MKIATPRFDLRLLDDGDGALYASLYGDPATMAFVAPALEPARLARAAISSTFCDVDMDSRTPMPFFRSRPFFQSS